ncbi:MAG: nucleoside hydrolase [Clostridia bacterium]|nr:nucleoside hydrolase [Clostridia bacterium]
MENIIKNSKKIIFDTDIGEDCDDAGALALIHKLCNNGEAELLAVTHCYNSPYLAGCIDAINTFYNREVPIGINYDAPILEVPQLIYADKLAINCPNKYPPETYLAKNGPKDTLELLRTTLANAEDGSVTIVVTGTLASMARLVLSKPDEISPLSGKELIAKKVNRTVFMGGRFFETWPMTLYESGDPTHHVMTWEYNVKRSGHKDAKAVFDNWPNELVLSSYEIGSYIVTMKGYGKRAQKGDPVALAYNISIGDNGRCSWDHTAVLEAVRPGVYWNKREFGKISIDENMVTHFIRCENGSHTYLLPKLDYETIRKTIDDLINEV